MEWMRSCAIRAHVLWLQGNVQFVVVRPKPMLAAVRPHPYPQVLVQRGRPQLHLPRQLRPAGGPVGHRAGVQARALQLC